MTFDGSIGPTGEWTCIGWAYLIELPSGQWVRHSGGKSGGPANNMAAEFEGLIHGLKWFSHASFERKTTDTFSRIIVRGDSKPLIDLLNGGETRNGLLTTLRDTVTGLLAQIDIPWEAKHIPKRLNKECNGLAQAELSACLRQLSLNTTKGHYV